MEIISDARQGQIKALFDGTCFRPVEVRFYYADGADPRTAAMQEALKRLAVAAGGRVRVQARGGREGQAEAAGYGVQQVPALAARFGVRAVPQTVIDGKSQVILVGAQPVGRWVAELIRACQSPCSGNGRRDAPSDVQARPICIGRKKPTNRRNCGLWAFTCHIDQA